MREPPNWLIQRLIYGLLLIPPIGIALLVIEGNPPGFGEIVILAVWVAVMLLIVRRFRMWPFND